jgi:hypothetical protein
VVHSVLEEQNEDSLDCDVKMKRQLDFMSLLCPSNHHASEVTRTIRSGTAHFRDAVDRLEKFVNQVRQTP